jgi:hypothetical protein
MGTKFRNKLGRYDRASDIVSGLVNAAARLGYLSISFSDLKIENSELADLISCSPVSV